MQSEAERLVLLAQEDEERHLARALEANMGLIVKRACASSVSGHEHEDLISEMRIAAIKAIRRYKPANGEWSSYLHLCLKHAMGTLIKHQQNKERWKLNNATEFKDWHPEHDGEYEQAHAIYWPIDGLAVKHGALLELRFLHERTYKDISRVYGCCTQNVQYMIPSAIKKAQAILSIQPKTKMGYDRKR